MVRPRVDSDGQKDLEKVEQQIETFKTDMKAVNVDPNNRDSFEGEPQTKLSNREAQKMDAPYIKPIRAINSKEPFNEKYRKDWEYKWQYVKCIVENKEIIGEEVETWTKKFAGDPAHFWKVPVNKPVYIPRLLAEQLASCSYNRLMMQDASPSNLGISGGGVGNFIGALQVEKTVHRIDARPVGFGF